MVAHVYYPSTREAETERLSSRLAWSTEVRLSQKSSMDLERQTS